jgi:3-isopropylmalate/(R)-2-methylmalate dehydratase small subunit
MSGYSIFSGKIAVYNEDNIDTDRIIPARFLTMVTRSGYGEKLFVDVRGDSYPLDRPEAQGASILIVGTNFGCGSSREHAVWAIQQAGFKVVIAKKNPNSSGYSDIFRQNAANCGLLLIELDPVAHDKIVKLGMGCEITIDLPNQKVIAGGESYGFDITPALKDALLKGLDLVGTTLTYEQKITEYEKTHNSFAPTDR